MPNHTKARRTAAGLICACSVYQVGLGVYFMAFRPPFLPEDLRFLDITAEQLAVGLPQLDRWLDLVFAVLGGQMAALGVLLASFGRRLWRGRTIDRAELILLGLGAISSVGVMSAANFALESVFQWVLILPVAMWIAGIALAASGISMQSTGPGKAEDAK